MHETLCFSRQSASPNVDDLPLRCDGCETVSCVVGSFSDHGRIILGPWSDRFRIVNGVSSVFRACAVDRIPLWFATVGSFPQCKWDCKWCWWMSCRWSFEPKGSKIEKNQSRLIFSLEIDFLKKINRFRLIFEKINRKKIKRTYAQNQSNFGSKINRKWKKNQ